MNSAMIKLGTARSRFLNQIRLRRGKVPDFLFMDLAGPLAEKPRYFPWWQRYQPAALRQPVPKHNLAELRHLLKIVQGDARVNGLVVDITSLESGWANAQSLITLFEEFKHAGKKLVFYADDFNILNYFVACQGDLIVMPPGSHWNVLGLSMSFSYLAELLETLGLKPEVIAISPFKGAGDTFSRTSMSDEQRQMMSWILDGQFEFLVQAIATGRQLTSAEICQRIDNVPYTAESALKNQLIDKVAYLDQLTELLADTPVTLDCKAPRMKPLHQILPYLLQPIEQPVDANIAIIPVEGNIQYGSSRSIPSPIPLPFVGNRQAGSQTFAQAVRRAEQDPSVAAIVVYINSPGGSALASDLMWRELDRARKRKPIVAYMGNVAASGGYYIAAACDHIVAQPLTITGSIGVLFIKLASQDFYENMYIHKESLQRGKRARLYDTEKLYNEEERALVEESIRDSYQQFKSRVLVGRPLDEEQLETVAGGRVWLGNQALQHKLVDQLGGLDDAIQKAKSLAGLQSSELAQIHWIHPGRRWQLPPAVAASLPWKSLRAVKQSWTQFENERLWFLMPFKLKISRKP